MLRSILASRWALLAAVFGSLLAATWAEGQYTRQSDGDIAELQKKRAREGSVLKIKKTSQDLSYYRSLVLGESRNHHIFVLFTLHGETCARCQQIASIWERVADSFAAVEAPVFFVEVELSRSYSAAQYHSIRRVPAIYHVAPHYDDTFIKKKGRDGTDQKGVDDVHNFLDRKLFEGPDWMLLEWCNSSSDHSVKQVQTLVDHAWVLIWIVTIFIALAFVLVSGITIVRRAPNIMPFAALAVQWIGTSGLMWCVIHGRMQLYVYDPHSQRTVWLSPNAQSQTLSEGLLCAGAIVLTAAGFCYMARQEGHPKDSTDRLAKRAFSTLAILLLCYCLYSWVMGIFAQKSGMGNESGFFPPRSFQRGPVQLDQQMSF